MLAKANKERRHLPHSVLSSPTGDKNTQDAEWLFATASASWETRNLAKIICPKVLRIFGHYENVAILQSESARFLT